MALVANNSETIFALATGVGRSAVAIVRVSGPESGPMLRLLVGDLPIARRGTVRAIREPGTDDVVDHALVLWFPGPSSFSGEDCVEFQVHGSRAVVSSLLRVLGSLPGLRHAEPGEFARQAFLNGKLDLIGVEALGDLIAAETEYQRRLAISRTSGSLQGVVEVLRARLIDALVAVESELDFSDEVAESLISREEICFACRDALEIISSLLAEAGRAELVRDGLTVLIAGPPNAGKSTLLNTIARRDVAIVSEYAGTTRDMIEVRLDLAGFPVNLIDTAGIQESVDPVEREGIRRALDRAVSADLILWLRPCHESICVPPFEINGRPVWLINTKLDELSSFDLRCGDRILAQDEFVAGLAISKTMSISAKTGENCEELICQLADFANEQMNIEASVVVANARQRTELSSAREAVLEACSVSLPLEIVAEELRRGCFHLESLLGKVGVEDVLDRIFSRFCIGK